MNSSLPALPVPYMYPTAFVLRFLLHAAQVRDVENGLIDFLDALSHRVSPNINNHVGLLDFSQSDATLASVVILALWATKVESRSPSLIKTPV